jgi:beta-galactosidase beta subunit
MRSPTTRLYLLPSLFLSVIVLFGIGVSQNYHLLRTYRDIDVNDAPKPRIQTSSYNNNTSITSPVPINNTIPAVGQQLEKTGSFANCTTHHNPFQDVNAPTRTTANHDDSFYDGKFTVSCHELYYRAPIESMEHHHQQQQNHPIQSRRPTTIVFGILSGSGEAESRATVRETWASTLDSGTVYFFVAGPWSDIMSEYEEKKDIVWVDMVEDYSKITYKTAAMMVVFSRHFQSFRYMFKTDTDTFVNTEELLKDLLQKNRRAENYYGYRVEGFKARDLLEQYPEMTIDYPEDLVPHFMIGAGYGLTRKFLNCSLEHLATIPFHPLEDIYTGLLGERCGLKCRGTQHTPDKKWRWDIGGDVRNTNLTGYVLSHKVTNASTMLSMWNSTIRSPDPINMTSFPDAINKTIPAVGRRLEKTGSFANCTTHHNPIQDVNAPTRTTTTHEYLFYDGKFTVSCHELYYRAPIDSMEQQYHNKHNPKRRRRPTTVVFGVLSGPGEAESRATVRETWASTLDPGTVYFFVAGPWSDIMSEYEEKKDIVWVDMVEDYSKLTYKTAAMMVVFSRVTSSPSGTCSRRTRIRLSTHWK